MAIMVEWGGVIAEIGEVERAALVTLTGNCRHRDSVDSATWYYISMGLRLIFCTSSYIHTK